MNKRLIYMLALCSISLVGCKDENDPSEFDPSQPVVFTDFTPKEGPVRTRMYIMGSNFGKDLSKIHISIGGQEAMTIGSDGKKLYCMVPKRAYDGNVSVRIDGKNGETVADYTFEEPFKYEARTVVGTLLRKVDEDGNSAFQDGSFDGEGSCPSNDWMVFDPKPSEDGDQILFSSNYYDGFRELNLTQRYVKRLFPRTQYAKMVSFTFTADGDTLLFPDDNGHGADNTAPNIYYALRSEQFRKIRAYNYGYCSYGCISMKDGSIFYSSWNDGAIYKMQRANDILPNIDVKPIKCFTLTAIGGGSAHTRLLLHPSEKYMYVFAPQRGAIMRSDYNEETKLFDTPRVIAGSLSSKGCTEGVGNVARFEEPWAGIFVKNREYEEANKKELYDFYFSDDVNHCIWKLTPEGVATMVAGRSNYNADKKYTGYVDGAPLTEARFNRPTSLAYDAEQEIFYIGDINNKGIRYLTTE